MLCKRSIGNSVFIKLFENFPRRDYSLKMFLFNEMYSEKGDRLLAHECKQLINGIWWNASRIKPLSLLHTRVLSRIRKKGGCENCFSSGSLLQTGRNVTSDIYKVNVKNGE